MPKEMGIDELKDYLEMGIDELKDRTVDAMTGAIRKEFAGKFILSDRCYEKLHELLYEHVTVCIEVSS